MTLVAQTAANVEQMLQQVARVKDDQPREPVAARTETVRGTSSGVAINWAIAVTVASAKAGARPTPIHPMPPPPPPPVLQGPTASGPPVSLGPPQTLTMQATPAGAISTPEAGDPLAGAPWRHRNLRKIEMPEEAAPAAMSPLPKAEPKVSTKPRMPPPNAAQWLEQKKTLPAPKAMAAKTQGSTAATTTAAKTCEPAAPPQARTHLYVVVFHL